MDSKKIRQVVNSLRRSLDDWDFKKAILNSNDEATTRAFLIHPFLELLNYQQITDFTHEYIADMGDKKGRKVDIAVTLGGKKPLMLIECKKATQKLNDNNLRQLNEYFNNTPSAKIGILTNGLNYKFYSTDSSRRVGLNVEPFFTFNIEDYNSSDLEMLALFNRTTIEINDIIDEAEEIYFLNRFDDSLFNLLSEPSDNFIKEIFYGMGGKKASSKNLTQIRELLNSMSLKQALDRVVQKEISSSNSGIITTEEEKKSFNVIKTIIAMSSKIKNSDLDRVGYRDLKGFFSIIVDDNQNKKICALRLKENSKVLEIAGKKYDLSDTSVTSIIAHKKELVESTLRNL
tara:strand:- start:241 stop:1275 length:1035 start_codon:yes stop_codon:yes gene_type:complete